MDSEKQRKCEVGRAGERKERESGWVGEGEGVRKGDNLGNTIT